MKKLLLLFISTFTLFACQSNNTVSTVTTQETTTTMQQTATNAVAQITTSQSVDNSTVSEEVKQKVDIFEKWIDELSVFIEEFPQATDKTTKLQQYTELMSRYGQIVTDIQTLSSTVSSKADSDYITNALERISEKINALNQLDIE